MMESTMITINKQTQHEIEKLNLHDAEIREIICNYYEHKVNIPVSILRKIIYFFRLC